MVKERSRVRVREVPEEPPSLEATIQTDLSGLTVLRDRLALDLTASVATLSTEGAKIAKKDWPAERRTERARDLLDGIAKTRGVIKDLDALIAALAPISKEE